jgi:hypothetical protein
MLDRPVAALNRIFDALQRDQRVDSPERAEGDSRALGLRRVRVGKRECATGRTPRGRRRRGNGKIMPA